MDDCLDLAVGKGKAGGEPKPTERMDDVIRLLCRERDHHGTMSRERYKNSTIRTIAEHI